MTMRIGMWMARGAAPLTTGLAALALLATVVAAPPAFAQETGAEAPPAADPADVESIDAIMAAVYDVISGGAGEARDWDRFMSRFIPEARLIPSGRNPQGQHGYQVLTPQQYVEGPGNWLVENVIVNGLNLGSTFRTQFEQSAQQYGGDLDQVIANWSSEIEVETAEAPAEAAAAQ